MADFGNVAVEPREGSRWLAGRGDAGWIVEAVEAGGGRVVAAAEAEALVWLEVDDPDALGQLLDANPRISWVQLPFAGIDPYRVLLDDRHLWTCAKSAYGDSVAEHALALTLAAFRDLGHHLRAESWRPLPGRNLYGARMTVLGGGGIARALMPLLAPFDVDVTVVRRSGAPLEGARAVVTPDRLTQALGGADVVVLALALTDESRGIIDTDALAAMRVDGWLVNVARGAHVVTDDLVAALESGSIVGAALDVTDPEPLPAGHPLWSLPNCLITPHVANTFEMLRPRLARMVSENVHRFLEGGDLLGRVDPTLGY